MGMVGSRKYIILGISTCCKHLQISSDGMANVFASSSMGEYEFYSTDPNGAVVYYNEKQNVFLTRDHFWNVWQVSQMG